MGDRLVKGIEGSLILFASKRAVLKVCKLISATTQHFDQKCAVPTGYI
jgi:hypothetical protein